MKKGPAKGKAEKPQKVTKQVKTLKNLEKKPVKSAPDKKAKNPAKSNLNKTTLKFPQKTKLPEKVNPERKPVKKTASFLRNISGPIQREIPPVQDKPADHIDLSLPEGSVYKQTGHRRPLIVIPK
jgi:hypothetical protein